MPQECRKGTVGGWLGCAVGEGRRTRTMLRSIVDTQLTPDLALLAAQLSSAHVALPNFALSVFKVLPRHEDMQNIQSISRCSYGRYIVPVYGR